MQKPFIGTGLAGLALTALLALTTQNAQAAPQALALVATNGPVRLTCTGGDCSAELSAFCLQPDRFSPKRGTAYHQANVGEIRLLGTTRDGREVALDAHELLRFESVRNHLAVRVTLPEGTLESLGVVEARIEVGERVALLPEAEPNDPAPMTESEIAVLTGPLRSVGTQIVDHDEGRMQAARVVNRMVNLLPSDRKVGLAGSESVWQDALRNGGTQGLSPVARRKAQGAYEFCRFLFDRGASSDLRGCLQKQHDGFLNFLNSDYWEAVKVGS